MQLSRSSARLGAILSLLGGALVIYGVFFLPMVFGNGGGDFTPTSEWTVVTVYFQYASPVAAVLLTLPLLSMLLVGGASAASLFRELSPGMVTWKRRAALAGLLIQAVLGSLMAVVYSFSFSFGAGFWLVLLGFVVMMVGTFLNSPPSSLG